MKRYIRASEGYQLPSGWKETSEKELIKLGYDMSDKFTKEDEEVCKESGLTLIGYAVNKDEELGLIARDDKTRKIEVYEHVNGRLYPVE